MKRALLLALCAAFTMGTVVGPAMARSVYKKQFEKFYVDEKKDKGFAEKVAKAKCNVCHYGKSKKNRNDYGVALSKLLDYDNYKTSRVKAEPDKVAEELNAAFKKVADMKNKAGKKYGELIKAGELPGTEPADAKK